MTNSERRSVQTASHWGVYRVETNSDRNTVLNSGPVAFDPHPSPLQAGLPQVVHDKLRIDQPYIREGYLRSRGHSREQRGSEPFVPVSWDVALGLVADSFAEARALHGNRSVYGGSYGWASAGRLHHAPSVLKRYLGLTGGYVDKTGNHSFGAALGVVPYILGRSDITKLVVSWPEIVNHTDLVVMFGGAALKNMQVDPGGAVNHDNIDWFAKARRAGVKVVCVSPARDDLPEESAPEWVPIIPNTDTAFMMGLAHTLVVEGLHAKSFLDRYCSGFDEFERYILGEVDGVTKDAQWAEGITGINAGSIVALARRMAQSRTLVNVSWSVQRADHGEQPVWMVITLASMLGQIGLPGCGFSLGFGAVSGIALSYPNGIPRPKMPLGPNPVSVSVPVGRVADLFLHPGGQLEHNGKKITLPKIEVVYSTGGNPFHHNTNLNRFLRSWKKPSTIVVNEPWWSPPAKYADIVLPSTTTLERNDIGAADHSKFWIAMHQVVEPYKQSRNDFDIFSELADRAGLGYEYHQGRNEMQWLEHMYEEARVTAQSAGFAPPNFEEFWVNDSYEFPLRESDSSVLLSEFRASPIENRLNTTSGKIEIVSESIRGFGYEDCPPHPSWLEPAEWLGGESASKYPLHLLT
ncbi:MAG: Asp-tRNA(Asn)/Glu-tRNA(Gln) amidotransferase GatCAB subunit C, partial [Alcaligenaceae bacterium]